MNFRDRIFRANREWADSVCSDDPEFFHRLANEQHPEVLWIGCSDSRVPASKIMGKMPGEVFVHRNIANLVLHTDMNCQSVIQYAVQVLKVEHVVVCGHYGCGGVKAAMTPQDDGIIQNWLRNITDIYSHHLSELEAIADPEARADRLCELNVLTQVKHLASSNSVQSAWQRGQPLALHSWIYSVHDGVLKDLEVDISSLKGIPAIYRAGKANK